MKNTKHCRLGWIIISLVSPLITSQKQSLRCFTAKYFVKSLHIPHNQSTELKSKLRNACHKYNNIKVSYKYQRIVKDLSNNKGIRILTQDKGRGVVIMDSSKYIEKSLNILDNEKFVKITNDPMKSIEYKMR